MFASCMLPRVNGVLNTA